MIVVNWWNTKFTKRVNTKLLFFRGKFYSMASSAWCQCYKPFSNFS